MSSTRPASGAFAFADSQFDRLGLELDADREAQRKAWRARQLNAIDIPRLRLLGCVLLGVGALLHNQFILPDAPWAQWYRRPSVAFGIVGLLVTYALGSWGLIVGLWNRGVRLHIFFLWFDLAVWTGVILLTGGTRSWLFFVMLVRVADQVPIGFRRTIGFALVAPIGYVAVATLDWAQGLEISRVAELCKVFFLYCVSLYVAFVARPAERRNAQRAGAIRIAKQLIRDLGDKSVQLVDAKLRAEAALDQQVTLAREKLVLYERTRHQQVQLQRIFDSTSDGIIFVARDGRIESANRRAGELLDFQPAAVVGASVLDVLGTSLGHVGGERPWRQTLEGLLASPDSTRIGDVQHPATRRVIQWAAQPTRDEFGESVGLTFTFQDVTRNRDLIRQLGYKSIQLEEANRRMEEASRAKEEFLANVSHEIRTPLSAIIGMTHLALEVQTPADRQRYLEKLKGSANSLLTVINDILDFSRIDAGRFSLDSAPFALHDVINGVVDTVRVAADSKGLDLKYDIARDVPDRLIGDAVRLRQILLNLMANAVKFTERGGVGIAVALDARSDREAVIRMAVSDTGIGIPPEKQQMVFEAFAQADGSTTRRYGGTGLGLSIASQLTKLMGGDISLQSEVGRGSTFRVTVRCGLAPDATAPVRPPDTARTAQPRQGLRVLLADDNAIQREVISHLLETGGYQAVVASGGREAVDEFRRGGIDVVLVDLQMPEMDGFQTAAAIRALEKPGAHVPIVAITASSLKADRERGLEVGISDFLAKPVSKEALLTVVAPGSGPGAEGHPSWRPVDRQSFLAGLGGDAELARKLIDLFLSNAPGLLAAVRESLDRGDAESLRRAAHALKGAMGNFPATVAQDMTARLELAGLDGDLEVARALYPALEREIARLTSSLPTLV